MLSQIIFRAVRLLSDIFRKNKIVHVWWPKWVSIEPIWSADNHKCYCKQFFSSRKVTFGHFSQKNIWCFDGQNRNQAIPFDTLTMISTFTQLFSSQNVKIKEYWLFWWPIFSLNKCLFWKSFTAIGKMSLQTWKVSLPVEMFHYIYLQLNDNAPLFWRW